MSTATGSLMVPASPLVLADTDDPIIPLVNARIMARMHANSTLHAYHDGHLGLITQPHELATVVTDFLLS